MRLRILLRRTLITGALGAVASVLAMTAGAIWVHTRSNHHVYDVSTVPAAPVALVLGAQVFDDGEPGPFLTPRLEIARQLLADGKVRAILVSGDHREWDYNEPGAMFRWLVNHGVPGDKIVLDHAGFDTYDSCARAHRVFGVDRAIVVTQDYHIGRAVALCRELGIDTDGVADSSVHDAEPLQWWHSALRERGAVVKALLDVVTGRDPVFLGPHETGVETAVA